MSRVAFSENLKRLRKEAGLTQEDIAKEFSISRYAIGGYEKAKRFPDVKKLVGIAAYFDCSTDYLLGLSDTKRPVPPNAYSFNEYQAAAQRTANPDVYSDDISQTEQAIIDNMARRIAKAGRVTASAEWQATRLEAIGTEREHLLRELSKGLYKAEEELIRLFDEAATRTLASDDQLYRSAGYNPIPLAENAYMQQIIRAGMIKTSSEYRNLTNTTANTVMKQFEDALDLAYQKITTGGFSYQQAIRSALRSLTRKRLGAIQYPTGHIDYLDVAFRRATLTGVNQTATELQLARMDEMGADLVETTAHHGARPSHAIWQGKWFSHSGTSTKYPDFISGTGYGSGEGLCGWNCRHSFFPVFEGLSDPAYSADKLREYNNRTIEYNGQTMSLYDATQQQRTIERKIRRWKREASAMDAAGLDNSAAKNKVREWQARQRDFIKQTGLRRDYFRERAGKQIA